MSGNKLHMILDLCPQLFQWLMLSSCPLMSLYRPHSHKLRAQVKKFAMPPLDGLRGSLRCDSLGTWDLWTNPTRKLGTHDYQRSLKCLPCALFQGCWVWFCTFVWGTVWEPSKRAVLVSSLRSLHENPWVTELPVPVTPASATLHPSFWHYRCCASHVLCFFSSSPF